MALPPLPTVTMTPAAFFPQKYFLDKVFRVVHGNPGQQDAMDQGGVVLRLPQQCASHAEEEDDAL